jgi:GAF domain-containing protein
MGHCPLSAVPDIGKLLEGTCREVDDLAHAPQLTAMEQLALDAGILSYAMVPLMARGRLIGSLNLGAPDPGIYRPALLALARKIGDHLAIALRHSETDRALRQHNADLQQALMIRDQMVENVSRELRTPLTQLVRCGELLRDGVLGGGFNDEETRALTAIIEEGRALARLVDALLSLKAPGGAAGPSSTVEDRAKSFTGALPRWQRGPKTGS